MQIQANLVFHLQYFLALFVMLFSLVVGQRTFSCWNSWGTCRIHLFFLVEFMWHMQDPFFSLAEIMGHTRIHLFFLVQFMGHVRIDLFFSLEIMGHMKIPSFLLDKIQGLSLKVRESMWSILLLQWFHLSL